MRWVSLFWWRYLLSGLWVRWRHDNWKLRELPGVVLCRLHGHPCGVVWHNPGGFEPDMTCRKCGDDL